MHRPAGAEVAFESQRERAAANLIRYQTRSAAGLPHVRARPTPSMLRAAHLAALCRCTAIMPQSAPDSSFPFRSGSAPHRGCTTWSRRPLVSSTLHYKPLRAMAKNDPFSGCVGNDGAMQAPFEGSRSRSPSISTRDSRVYPRVLIETRAKPSCVRRAPSIVSVTSDAAVH